MRLIYGAGGHGRVLLDTLRASGIEVDGFVDPPKAGRMVDDVQVFDDSVLTPDCEVFHGIGYIEVRRRVDAELAARGVQAARVVHPTAWISPRAEIGPGTVVYAGVVVNTGARVGRCAILNSGCVVEHDAVVGDFAHVSPNATLGGAAELGDSSWAGIGSVVIPLVKVGRSTILGAGAVAVRDLPDGVVAVGAPARVMRERTAEEMA